MYSLYTNPLRSLDCPAYEWIAKVSIIANHCQSFSIIAIFANHCLSFPLTFLGNNGCYEEAIIGSDNSFIMSTATTQLHVDTNCPMDTFWFFTQPMSFCHNSFTISKISNKSATFWLHGKHRRVHVYPQSQHWAESILGLCAAGSFISYLLNSSCGRLWEAVGGFYSIFVE